MKKKEKMVKISFTVPESLVNRTERDRGQFSLEEIYTAVFYATEAAGARLAAFLNEKNKPISIKKIKKDKK